MTAYLSIIYVPMPEYPIVEPRNARNKEYRDHLNQILESGRCPFCPGGDTYEKQERLAENEHWIASRNYHPLKGTLHHFLFTPKRHVIYRSEFSGKELKALVEVENEIKLAHDIDGCIIFGREGDPMVTGASVLHLHFQMVVPDGLMQLHLGRLEDANLQP